ncbi:MAG: hypothetical protein JRN35_04845 [Nitrososphaerota archaeon]|jgi:hypothetical protein|nr:hypothetical protein [Candidatus Thermoplasmatota archaeon]MDG6912390.1 hypothetical protein [Nitrososphaerota archaeon]
MISSGTAGAVEELRVSQDLMARGFHVFRNMGPNGPVDLMALSPRGRVYLLQVTAGRKKGRGKCGGYSPHANVRVWNVLAVSYPDRVRYQTRDGKEMVFRGGNLVVPDHPTIVLKLRTRRRPRTPNNALPVLMSARAAREEENRKMEVEFRRQYPLPTWPTVEEIASEFAEMGDRSGDSVSDPPTGRAPSPTTQ